MTYERKVFRNAPITEAILDIKIKPSGPIDPLVFKNFNDPIKEIYNVREQQYTFKGGINFVPGKENSINTSTNLRGFIFKSTEQGKIIQTNIEGFTFNKLRPYQNWDSFYKEAKQHWELFSKIVQPKCIWRISLRYINKIEIPLPIKDFNEYFNTYPQMASSLPQALSYYMIRLEMPNEKIGAHAIITIATDKQKQPEKLPIILDIDVIKINEYTSELNKIWDDFQMLAQFKNDIFFESLTEKAKELFE